MDEQIRPLRMGGRIYFIKTRQICLAGCHNTEDEEIWEIRFLSVIEEKTGFIRRICSIKN